MSICSTGLSVDEKKAAPSRARAARRRPGVAAEWATVANWCAISGFGQTRTYELIALGILRAKKAGRRTLVHVPSGLDFIESLPDANLTTGLSRRRPTADGVGKAPAARLRPKGAAPEAAPPS